MTEIAASSPSDVDHSADTHPEFKMGVGVSGKLMLAFGTCAALTVVMGLISWLGVNAIGNKLNAITSESLPLISAAMELSQETARLTSEAPKLVAAAREQD